MKALVLSGGGSKGAWQVGAMEALYRDYDIICGVSVGALNGSLLATFEDSRFGIQSLTQIWKTLETKQVHKKWFMWPFSVPWKPSVYNSAPLEKWVRGVLGGRDFHKRLCVGAVSYNTGEYLTFDEHSSQIIEAVIASASFPGFLKPVQIGSDWWVDGGVREVTPLGAAITRGATEIDVVTLTPEAPDLRWKEPKTFGVLTRTLELMGNEIVENDLKVCKAYNKALRAGADLPGKKEVQLRIFRPQNTLGVNPLEFNPEQNKRLMEQGFRECMKLRNTYY